MKQHVDAIDVPGTNPSSSGDPQEDFEMAQLAPTLISPEAKRLIVLASAAAYSAWRLIEVSKKRETGRVRPVVDTGIVMAVAATAWAQYNRLQNTSR